MLPHPRVCGADGSVPRLTIVEVAEAVEAALKLACALPRFRCRRFAP